MKTILIVEDEYPLMTNIEEILSEAGYKTITAQNGREALGKLYENIPDLVISDIKMPEMDGLELLNYLQDKPEFMNIPFIFLTAKAELSDVREGMLLGAEDYLTKPFTTSDLLKTIDLRLKKKEAVMKPFEDLRDNIFSKVPHELRTPLITVLGFSQLILDNLETLSLNDMREMVRSIASSGNRLHARVEKFITYTEVLMSLKDDQIKDKLRRNRTNINTKFVKSVLENTIRKYDRSEDLTFYIDAALLKIDESYMVHILNEIVENSLAYSTKGTPVTILGIYLGTNYIFHVNNYGAGIPMNEIYKTNLLVKVNDNTGLTHGSGLGLLIVKKISELFGCVFELKSKIGEYTKINIKIPVENVG